MVILATSACTNSQCWVTGQVSGSSVTCHALLGAVLWLVLSLASALGSSQHSLVGGEDQLAQPGARQASRCLARYPLLFAALVITTA